MSDRMLIVMYIPLAFLSALIILSCLLFDRRKRLTRMVLCLVLSLLGWQLLTILYYATTDFALSYALYDIGLPFVALTALSIFLLVIRFYSLDHYLSSAMIAVLCVFPVITAVLSMTGGMHPFLHNSLVILSTNPLHEAMNDRGMWFWVHTGYCYILIGTSMCVSIVQHFRIPRIFRGPSTLLFAAMVTSIVGNFFVLRGALSVPLDFSLIGGSLSTVFIYLATRNNQGLDFLYQARNDIFNHLDDIIFILDDRGTITSRNDAAVRWLPMIGLDAYEPSYAMVTDTLASKAVHRVVSDDGDRSLEYHFNLGDRIATLSLREKGIHDKQGQLIGTFALLADVTHNRALIHRLETDAGMDALTGLSNHRKMESFKKQLDSADNLPLSVIMGDLNNLKVVNDTHGHQQGDVLLRAAADILVASCPPNARIGRVGGDEYLVLLPECSAPQAEALMADIRAHMAAENSYPFPISMALGTCTKLEMGESLSGVIRLADDHMYADKRSSNMARQ